MATKYLGSSGVEEGARGSEPPSCDLMGAQPPNSVYFLALRAYINHYSVMNGYFRFKRLWRNRYITRYREVKLRCLQENIGFKVSYKDACKKRVPLAVNRAPLAIGLLLHHCYEVPTKCLRSAYEVPTKYLRNTYEIPTKYLRSTYEVPTKYPAPRLHLNFLLQFVFRNV